jgi:thiamine kinase-like enzyme
MHGDFAPWNILVEGGKNATLIDWEYGFLEGIPYLDLAHFILQVGHLMYRWSPTRTLEWGTRYLASRRWANITAPEARWLILLAAHYAHEQNSLDGLNPSTPTQSWRRSLWEDKLWASGA